MTDTQALIRLLSWLSPALPIGGFAYSQGLETAIGSGRVATIDDVRCWVEGQLAAGSLRNDAYFLAIAAEMVGRGDEEGFARTSELALALQSGAERDAETREQARSFLDAASAWPLELPAWLQIQLEAPLPLPVAVGAVAVLSGIETKALAAGFLNAAVNQQISVAVRLVPLGQTEGLKLLAALEPRIADIALAACAADLDAISSISYGADIAAMRHEDLKVRIFRS